ncbi:MAG: hypothetical protein HOY79_50040 [Streptomyces sp.]|nr:hypothetical protein [Streptomyces sp.]
MTDARQLPIFADCPYGGCEDGYCACLEQDVDPDDLQAELDLCGEMYAVRRFRRIETVPISIDEYPPEGARP